MYNLSPRRLLTRAGTGAVAIALVGLAGYSVGQSQSPRASAIAASSPSISTPVSNPIPVGSYANVVNAVAPAVVTIRVEKRASMVPTQMPQLPDDPMFREFFGRRFQNPQRQPRIPRQSGLGSGVITTPDGYILTNNHVIDSADRVRVELTDKRTFDAKVVGTDPASDLAVLKVDAQGLRTLPLGDSNKVSVGDVVLAIGNPLSVGQTVTMGIISAKGRATNIGDGYEDFLQTDAAINQGNSGGALINLNGELVGINSQILTPTGGNIGLGFAIPSNMARQVMDQLKTEGKVSRSQLGVTVQNITADIAASLKLADVSGALVSGVQPGSPAARAGLRQGDVIVSLDGEKLTDNNALRNRIAGTKPGSKVAVEILRDGRKETLYATVELKPASTTRAAGSEGADAEGFGMTVQPLTPDVARELDLPDGRREGVVIREVDPDGAAAAAGLQPGDVIVQVNGKAVTSASALKSALGQAGDRPALLLVARQGGEVFVTVGRGKS
jgi:Do/DeqQ family serine protease